ncbi:MAG: glycosyltransferase [Butyrivibrio sp.]|nr:glycosyltransferase [Butyrivibrio sp.]
MDNEEQKSMRLIDFFLESPNSLDTLSRQDCKDILMLACMTAESTNQTEIKGKCYSLLYECCFHMDLDIKELWNIYIILNDNLFIDANIPFRGYLDKLYRFIFLKIKEPLSDLYVPYTNTSSNLIVITTDQFLRIGHAPTRRVLDYAYAIVSGLGKAVMIVNGADLNFHKCHSLIYSREFNFLEELNNVKHINYKGIEFPFMQIDAKMPDLYCIREALDEIYSLQPELVYNIGGSEILADLCQMFTKTCCFPCSTNIPITMSRYLLVGRKLQSFDSERLSRLEDYQRTVETVVNYQLPQYGGNPYKRSDWNISDSDFVFGMVGNRLDDEIDEAFTDLINRILSDSDAHFLIIGNLRNTERILNAVSKPEKIHFTGRLSDAALAVGLFDVYLNPHRNGGGRSSFEALAQGVPVITFAYGDVYYTCGDEFAVEDSEDFAETAFRYITDCEYREEQRRRGLKRAERLSGIASTQREALDKILND